MAQFVALRASHGKSVRIRVPTVSALGAPASPAVTPVVGGGTFSAATYYWKIVAINSSGNSLPSAEVNTAVAASGSANLSWTAVPGATSYQIWRGTTTGTENHYQTSSTNSFTDTGAVGTAGTLPTTDTGTVSGTYAMLSATVDTIVDLDNAATRQALGHHKSINQYIVTAANNTYGAAGSKSALSSNS